MADSDYWNWYANAFGQQQPAQEPLPQVSDWDAFYRSVGINPASAVGGAPTTRSVASVPVNLPPLPRPVPERTQTIATFPTKTVSDLVRGQSGGYVPDRLTASEGIPANYGGLTPQQVAQMGVGLSNEVNALGQRVTEEPGLRILVDGANPIMASSSKVAPTPYPPYRQVASQTATQAPAVRVQAPASAQRTAPSPLMQSAALAAQRAPQRAAMGLGLPAWTGSVAGRTSVIDTALRSAFNGNQPQAAVASQPMKSIPQDGKGHSPTYQDLGNGKFQDNLGGVYFTRNL